MSGNNRNGGNNNFTPQQGGHHDALTNWMKGIPLITKLFFFPTFIFGALVTYQIISAYSLIFSYPAITSHFQIWRLLTPFVFAGKFSFGFAMHLYMIYSYFPRYENNPYNTGDGGSLADVTYLILLSMPLLLLIGYFMNLMILSESILFVMIYLWSRKESEGQVSIFGFKFKAVYVPWVYLALKILMGDSIIPALAGIVVGHVYFYLVEIFPVVYGYQVIKTPKFCKSLVIFLLKLLPTNLTDTNAANEQFQPRGGGGISRNVAGNTRFGSVNSSSGSGQASSSSSGAAAVGGGGASNAGRPASYQWGSGRKLGSN